MKASEMKVSDPAAEAFPKASEARQKARDGFRFQVERLLQQAISAGMTKLELNVTEVLTSFTDELDAELKIQEYQTKRSVHVRNGESQKILTITW